MNNNWLQKSLTPQLLKEGEPSYNTVEDLLHALDNDQMLNIAVTGPYGSGKSSVLRTLISKASSEHKFLDLSLATLEADDSITEEADDSKEDANNGAEKNNLSSGSTNISIYNGPEKEDADHEVLNRKIEYSILQQLVYRETLETLPFSRLKKIRHLSEGKIKEVAGYALGLIICIAVAFFPEMLKLDLVFSILNMPEGFQQAINIIAIIFLFIMVYETMTVIIRNFNGTRLQHVNVGGNEIDMQDEGSIFNRYLDEILYFFQCTDYNVVIIEDLDRFNNADIFLKLRELNHLINKSKIVGRKIKFIYAVKDDMFRDSSRSKFFDYITTVIPVITTNNSKDKLRDALIELGHAGEIKDKDIRDIAFYIDDMRLLYNIANEYHQYRTRLNSNPGSEKIEAHKLLAMIVIKNYHPHDFSQLHKREGKLYKALSPDMKRQYVDFAIEKRVQESIDAAATRLEAFDRTCHLSETELRLVYVDAIANSLSADIISIEINGSYYDRHQIAENEELFNTLIAKDKVQYRVDYYNNYVRTQTASFKFESIEPQVNSLLSYSYRLEQLRAGRDKLERELETAKMNKSRVQSFTIQELLLKFNIYQETFFKELGLSEMEEDFIRRGFVGEDYHDYISYFYPGMMTLSDRGLCLSMRLGRETDFDDRIDNPEVFLTELPEEAMRYQSVYNYDLLDYLAANDIQFEIHYKLFLETLMTHHPCTFLAQYITKGENHLKVFKDCMRNNPQKLWNNIAFGKEDEKLTLSKEWLLVCEKKDIKKQQNMWCNEHFDAVASIYGNLCDDVKLYLTTNLNYTLLTETNAEFVKAVVENGCYVLSVENIPLIVKYNQAASDITKLNGREEQQLALQTKLLDYTWHNAKGYYNTCDLVVDDALCNFVQEGVDCLCASPESKEEEYTTIIQSLLECANLKFASFVNLCKLQPERIEYTDAIYSLGESKLIEFVQIITAESDQEIFRKLCAVSSKAALTYLLKHRDKFEDLLNSITLDTELAMELLTSDSFNEIEYRTIIRFMDPTNVSPDTTLATRICQILSNRYSECNQDILHTCMSKCRPQHYAVMAAMQHITSASNEASVIDADLKALGNPYDNIAESGKHVKLDKDNANLALVKCLDECDYISSFTEDGSTFKVNTKRIK